MKVLCDEPFRSLCLMLGSPVRFSFVFIFGLSFLDCHSVVGDAFFWCIVELWLSNCIQFVL